MQFADNIGPVSLSEAATAQPETTQPPQTMEPWSVLSNPLDFNRAIAADPPRLFISTNPHVRFEGLKDGKARCNFSGWDDARVCLAHEEIVLRFGAQGWEMTIRERTKA